METSFRGAVNDYYPDGRSQRWVAVALLALGLASAALGAGGLAAYVFIHCLPVTVHMCLLLVLGGTAVVCSQLSVDDRVLFGYSIADGIVIMVAHYREAWARCALLLATPDLCAGDVALVVRQFRDSADGAACRGVHGKLGPGAVTGGGGGGSGGSGGRCGGAGGGGVLTRRWSGSILGARWGDSVNGGNAFDLAVCWLRRPRLAVNLFDQLRLHAVYMQATLGDESGSTGEGTCGENLFGGALARAKMEAWRALHGLPRPAMRRRLPAALAEVDLAFVAAHPQLAEPRAQGHLGWVVLQLLERRLPRDLGDRVARAQSLCLGGALAATVLAALAALVGAARRRHASAASSVVGPARRWPQFLAVLGVAWSLYCRTVVRGLPAELHAAVLLRLWPSGCAGRDVLMPKPGNTFGRLWRFIVGAVTPRVSDSLFSEENCWRDMSRVRALRRTRTI